MDTVYKYNGSVCSDLLQLKDFLENILCNLENYIFDEDTMFDLKLILDELMVNGIIHGNEKDEDKYVHLNIILKESSIIIKVVDEGCGIDCDLNNYDYNNLKSFGRGLILVKALTDNLILNKNEITVVKKL